MKPTSEKRGCRGCGEVEYHARGCAFHAGTADNGQYRVLDSERIPERHEYVCEGDENCSRNAEFETKVRGQAALYTDGWIRLCKRCRDAAEANGILEESRAIQPRDAEVHQVSDAGRIGGERCEWNPVLRTPSLDPPRDTDCLNETWWSIGHGDKNFHVCDSCSKLPEFHLRSRRIPINANPLAEFHEVEILFDGESVAKSAGGSDCDHQLSSLVAEIKRRASQPQPVAEQACPECPHLAHQSGECQEMAETGNVLDGYDCGCTFPAPLGEPTVMDVVAGGTGYDLRHINPACTEFLCLPELKPHHYEVIAPVSAETPLTCKWTEDPDGVWWTACGEGFTLNDGTPTENKMRFCYRCGKPLEEVRIEP